MLRILIVMMYKIIVLIIGFQLLFVDNLFCCWCSTSVDVVEDTPTVTVPVIPVSRTIQFDLSDIKNTVTQGLDYIVDRSRRRWDVTTSKTIYCDEIVGVTDYRKKVKQLFLEASTVSSIENFIDGRRHWTGDIYFAFKISLPENYIEKIEKISVRRASH